MYLLICQCKVIIAVTNLLIVLSKISLIYSYRLKEAKLSLFNFIDFNIVMSKPKITLCNSKAVFSVNFFNKIYVNAIALLSLIQMAKLMKETPNTGYLFNQYLKVLDLILCILFFVILFYKITLRSFYMKRRLLIGNFCRFWVLKHSNNPFFTMIKQFCKLLNAINLPFNKFRTEYCFAIQQRIKDSLT